MARLLVFGFHFLMAAAQIVIFCILHHLVCFVWSCISKQCTAPIWFGSGGWWHDSVGNNASVLHHYLFSTICGRTARVPV